MSRMDNENENEMGDISVTWRTSLSIVMLFSVTFNLNCDGGTGTATGTAVASFIVVTEDFCGTLILAVSRSLELLWAMPGNEDEDGTKKKREHAWEFFFDFFCRIYFYFHSHFTMCMNKKMSWLFVLGNFIITLQSNRFVIIGGKKIGQ